MCSPLKVSNVSYFEINIFSNDNDTENVQFLDYNSGDIWSTTETLRSLLNRCS